MTARRLEALWFLQDPCNYACPYCVVSGGLRDKRPWMTSPHSADAWAEAWDRLADAHGPAWIRLTGGEPTAFPGFLELAGRLARRHEGVSFDTNMSWSFEAMERFAALVPPAKTTVDASVHPTQCDPREVRDKAAWLRDRGYRVLCRLVGWPGQLARVPELRALFGGAGLPFIVNPYQGPWAGKEYPRDYTADERRLLGEGTALDETRSDDREQVEIAGHILRMHEESPKGRLCSSGHLYARVMHDGSVYRCQPYESRGWEPLGNLLDPGFRLRPGPAPCRSEWCEFEFRYLVPQEAAR